MTQFPRCHGPASGSPPGHHVFSDMGLPRQFLNSLHLFLLFDGMIIGLFFFFFNYKTMKQKETAQ